MMGNEPRWGRPKAHWICPMWHNTLCKMNFKNRHRVQAAPEVTEDSDHHKLLPTDCDLCHRSAIYWSVLSSILFTPEAGIRLQTASVTTAFLVDSIGLTTPNMGFVTFLLHQIRTVRIRHCSNISSCMQFNHQQCGYVFVIAFQKAMISHIYMCFYFPFWLTDLSVCFLDVVLVLPNRYASRTGGI